MSTDSSTLHSQMTKVLAKSRKSRKNSEQTGNQDPQDGQSSSIKDIKFSGNSEYRGDHGPEGGQSSSIRAPSPEPQRNTINVVLFGETGVGKSAIINLIARRDIAKVSSDIYGCTTQHQCYHISFDNMDFAIFDTIGLEQPEMAVNGHLQAIEKAHELVSKLSAAGGIHLLLFCMRGGRMTTTAQNNHRLFSEHLCNTKAPIALVFTGLEMEVEMEDWWRRNKAHIEQYGIKSDGHACITAIQNGVPEGQRKYEQSQETIRELLKSCASKGKAFLLDPDPRFVGFSRKMKGFVPGKESPEKEIMKGLTNRCQLDVGTARRTTEMIDKSDKDEEGGVGRDGATKNPTTNGTLLGEQDTKAASGVSANGGKGLLLQEPSDVKTGPLVVPGKDVAKDVVDASVLQDHSRVKAPFVIPNRGKDITKDVDGLVQEPRSVKALSVGPGEVTQEATKKYVEDGTLAQSSSLRDSSPETLRQTINVVLFAESDAGKSSVINLIARRDIAKVSSDVNGCTMQSHCYSIPFDNMDFAIYDTIGLEEPQMGVNGYLKAIEKAHELISKLSAAGGIHLLLFCMRGGRITATTQSNYRLFCECLCNTKVPIALVFTGLEREVEMEDYWTRTRTHIEHYGIRSNGHACITAVPGDSPEEDRKYQESQETIRTLLKTCSCKGEAFSLESYSWFAGFSRKMKDFVPEKKRPKKKDILKVLTNRCKLDTDTAKRTTEIIESVPAKNQEDAMNVLMNRCKLDMDTARMIAEMMDRMKDGGNGKDGPTKNPTTNGTSPGEQDTKVTYDVSANAVKEVVRDGGPPQELGNVKVVPDVVAKGGKNPLLRKLSDVGALLGVVPVKEIEKMGDTHAVSVSQKSRSVKAPLIVPGKEIAKGNVVDHGSVKAPLIVPGKEIAKGNVVDHGSVKAPFIVPGKETAKGNVVDHGSVRAPFVSPNGGKKVDNPAQESGSVKASSVIPGKEIVKKNVADSGALQGPSSVKAPIVVPNGGKNVEGPDQESRSVKAPSVVPGKEVAKKNVTDSSALQGPSSVKAPLVAPNSGKKVDNPAQESRSAKAPSVVPGKEVTKKNVADSGALRGPSSVKAPLVSPNGGRKVDNPAQESRSAKAPSVVPGKAVTKKNVADSGGSSSVKAPLVAPNSGKNVDGPAQESRSVKAPSVVPGKEATKKYATDGLLPQESIGLKAVPAVPSGGHDIAKKSVTSAGVLSSVIGRGAEKSGAKESIRRNTKKRGDSGTAGVTSASSQS